MAFTGLGYQAGMNRRAADGGPEKVFELTPAPVAPEGDAGAPVAQAPEYSVGDYVRRQDKNGAEIGKVVSVSNGIVTVDFGAVEMEYSGEMLDDLEMATEQEYMSERLDETSSQIGDLVEKKVQEQSLLNQVETMGLDADEIEDQANEMVNDIVSEIGGPLASDMETDLFAGEVPEDYKPSDEFDDELAIDETEDEGAPEKPDMGKVKAEGALKKRGEYAPDEFGNGLYELKNLAAGLVLAESAGTSDAIATYVYPQFAGSENSFEDDFGQALSLFAQQVLDFCREWQDELGKGKTNHPDEHVLWGIAKEAPRFDPYRSNYDALMDDIHLLAESTAIQKGMKYHRMGLASKRTASRIEEVDLDIPGNISARINKLYVKVTVNDDGSWGLGQVRNRADNQPFHVSNALWIDMLDYVSEKLGLDKDKRIQGVVASKRIANDEYDSQYEKQSSAFVEILSDIFDVSVPDETLENALGDESVLQDLMDKYAKGVVKRYSYKFVRDYLNRNLRQKTIDAVKKSLEFSFEHVSSKRTANDEYTTALAEKGIDIGKFEDSMAGGMADKKKIVDFPLDGLLAGIDVEVEHTNDPYIALEIAMDHLTEDENYYTKLTEMEKEAGVNGWDLKCDGDCVISYNGKTALLAKMNGKSQDEFEKEFGSKMGKHLAGVPDLEEGTFGGKKVIELFPSDIEVADGWNVNKTPSLVIEKEDDDFRCALETKSEVYTEKYFNDLKDAIAWANRFVLDFSLLFDVLENMPKEAILSPMEYAKKLWQKASGDFTRALEMLEGQRGKGATPAFWERVEDALMGMDGNGMAVASKRVAFIENAEIFGVKFVAEVNENYDAILMANGSVLFSNKNNDLKSAIENLQKGIEEYMVGLVELKIPDNFVDLVTVALGNTKGNGIGFEFSKTRDGVDFKLVDLKTGTNVTSAKVFASYDDAKQYAENMVNKFGFVLEDLWAALADRYRSASKRVADSNVPVMVGDVEVTDEKGGRPDLTPEEQTDLTKLVNKNQGLTPANPDETAQLDQMVIPRKNVPGTPEGYYDFGGNTASKQASDDKKKKERKYYRRPETSSTDNTSTELTPTHGVGDTVMNPIQAAIRAWKKGAAIVDITNKNRVKTAKCVVRQYDSCEGCVSKHDFSNKIGQDVTDYGEGPETYYIYECELGYEYGDIGGANPFDKCPKPMTEQDFAECKQMNVDIDAVVDNWTRIDKQSSDQSTDVKAEEI